MKGRKREGGRDKGRGREGVRVRWIGIGGDCVMFERRRRRDCREWRERKVKERREDERVRLQRKKKERKRGEKRGHRQRHSEHRGRYVHAVIQGALT